jgi:hypothetical protein
MDGEGNRELTRPPGENDVVSLARELNRLAVAYVIVGGFAINRLGLVRATEDVDLLIAKDRANQALVKKALEILPDKAIRELGDEDIAKWVVVRVNDDITVDLMTEACGVTYEEAKSGIEIETIDGVPIPFAGAELMLKMKQGARDKDAWDRSFLQQLIRTRELARQKTTDDDCDPASNPARREQQRDLEIGGD